jgi:hypothetical protein
MNFTKSRSNPPLMSIIYFITSYLTKKEIGY